MSCRTNRILGSGLGLFISRELVELQGGQIGVHSEFGKGSTFAFYVETARIEPPVESPAVQSAQPSNSDLPRVVDGPIAQRTHAPDLHVLGEYDTFTHDDLLLTISSRRGQRNQSEDSRSAASQDRLCEGPCCRSWSRCSRDFVHYYLPQSRWR